MWSTWDADIKTTLRKGNWSLETVLTKTNHPLNEKQGVLRYGRFGILYSQHRGAITGTINNRLPLKEKKLFHVEVDSLTSMCNTQEAWSFVLFIKKNACKPHFNEQNKRPNLLSIITWSVLGKQNVQAERSIPAMSLSILRFICATKSERSKNLPKCLSLIVTLYILYSRFKINVVFMS